MDSMVWGQAPRDNWPEFVNGFAGNANMGAERIAEFLEVFVHVTREGSFSAAARRMGVAPSSITRSIDTLEARLGTPVFRRSTRLITLTEAGAALLVRAQRVLDELADAQQEIAALSGGAHGVLRVACFPTFGKRYVIPVVALLAKTHPQLRVELDLTERLADPVAERLDAVIRIGKLPDSSLVATKIATQIRTLCASPSYISALGAPTSLDDLPNYQLIDKLHGADLLGWSDFLGHGVLPDQAVFRCDDFEAMRLAALAGVGIALLPDWVVGNDIATGHLLKLTAGPSDSKCLHSDIHLLRAPVEPSAKLRVFSEQLKRFIGEPHRWAV